MNPSRPWLPFWMTCERRTQTGAPRASVYRTQSTARNAFERLSARRAKTVCPAHENEWHFHFSPERREVNTVVDQLRHDCCSCIVSSRPPLPLASALSSTTCRHRLGTAQSPCAATGPRAQSGVQLTSEVSGRHRGYVTTLHPQFPRDHLECTVLNLFRSTPGNVTRVL